MKTLKEYADFLYKNGYKENITPYTFLNGSLIDVEFIKNDFRLILHIEETEEFSKYIDSLAPGTTYKVEFENYIVNGAFIESPICNVSNYFDGSTNGIELVSKANTYNKHTLDLFKFCIKFQETNLLEHELFIMSRRQEHLIWAKNNLIPILENCDFYVDYDSFFDTKQEKNSSNIRIDFKHPNRATFVIEIDCLTGKPIIWVDINSVNGTIELTDKIYGKTKEEVSTILLEEVWKTDFLKFGYIYSNDPHNTKETYNEVLNLLDCLHYNEKRKNINFDVIPEKYNDLVKKYNKNITENNE